MACDANTSRIAKLAGRMSGAISQLSSKQAFFAGMAVGASGTGLGAFLLAKRQRLANVFRGRQPASGPGRQSRPKPTPKPIPGLAGGSPARSKPKPIPGLADASAAKPKPIPGLSKRQPLPTLRAEPPRPELGTKAQDEALSDASASQTKLQAGPVQVLGRDGQAFTVQNSYRVVRPDGSDTGLAITPHLRSTWRPAQVEPGDKGQTVERPDAWSVTHAGSGALIDGPYPTIAQAQGLATELSALRWTASSVPKADVDRAKALIGQYRQRLEGIKTG